MSFKTIYAPTMGLGCLGGMVYAEKQQFKVFVPTAFPDTDEAGISLSSYTGAFLGQIPIDVQDVVLSSMEFRYGDEGAIDFTLELNQEPPVPLLRFTEISFAIGNDKVFRGYVWKSPGPDKQQSDSWKYTGYGIPKRLEKAKITLKPDIDIYQIDHIEQDGSDVKVYTTIPIVSSDLVGRVCIITDCDDDNNDGRFDATEEGEFNEYLRFANPAGLDQVLSVGLLYVLPKEWSDPTTTVSDLVKQVVSNYMTDLPISGGVGSVEDSPSVLTGSVVYLDKMILSEFFKQIRMIAPDYEFFIDPDNVVVFRKRQTTPVSVVIVGYDLQNVKNTVNDDEAYNRWNVHRKIGKEEKRPGFELGGLAQDATAIKNFGLLEGDEEVPVYYGDPLCQQMAESLVQQTKDPKDVFEVTDAPFRYYRPGPWKIVTAPRAQETTLTGCESTDEWTPTGPLALSINTALLVKGAGALKVAFDSDAAGAQVTADFNFPTVDPVFLRFWYKGKRIGQKIKFAFADDVVDFDDPQKAKDVFVYSTRYRRMDIPIDRVDINRIGQLGFQIQDPEDGDFFLVDEISIYSTVSNHKVIQLKEVKLFMGNRRRANLIFGALPSRLDDYLAGTFRAAKMVKLALKD